MGFSMANEAFALSPISARAAQPSEEDYAAISEAFMETSRGRWFLTEYAKRNRNADTRLVLDAVARLEESLAAQRRAAAVEVEDKRLKQALAAVRDAVAAAQASALEAFDGLTLEQKLVPVRKGARVIREIAWRLREIGNDGRICDLIDSQVAVIEKAAAQISSDEAEAALDAHSLRLGNVWRNRCCAGIQRRRRRGNRRLDRRRRRRPAVVPLPCAAQIPNLRRKPAGVVARADRAGATQYATEAAAETFNGEAALAARRARPRRDRCGRRWHASATRRPPTPHDEAVLDMIAMEMGAADPNSISTTPR